MKSLYGRMDLYSACTMARGHFVYMSPCLLGTKDPRIDRYERDEEWLVITSKIAYPLVVSRQARLSRAQSVLHRFSLWSARAFFDQAGLTLPRPKDIQNDSACHLCVLDCSLGLVNAPLSIAELDAGF